MGATSRPPAPLRPAGTTCGTEIFPSALLASVLVTTGRDGRLNPTRATSVGSMSEGDTTLKLTFEFYLEMWRE